MKQKTWLRISLILSLVTAVLCGTALALMFRQTRVIDNHFEPAEVDCVVHEKLDGSGDYTQGEQYAERKTGITVKNTSNIDAYIRVRFVSYWKDVNGNIVGKPSKMPTISITEDWIKDGDTYTYYHKRPVSPEQHTAELLRDPIVLCMEDGYIQVLEVFADAIQSLPEDAAEKSWSVTIDGNQIVSVP